MGRLGSISRSQWTFGLLVSGLCFLVAESRYQIMRVRPIDLFVVIAVALAIPALWFALGQYRNKDNHPRSDRDLFAFLALAIGVGFLTTASLLAFNAVLDPGSPKDLVGVVTSLQCYKTSCRAHVKGLPVGLVTGDSMVLDLYPGFQGRPHEWDSVFVTIMPGYFGRAWVSSHTFRSVNRDSLGGTQLAQAAATGDTLRIGNLLRHNVSVDALNARGQTYGETALMAAARAGKPAALASLLAHGADPNRANDKGETPLMLAVMSRSIECVRLLLASGASPIAQTRGDVVISVMGLAEQAGDTLIIRTIAAAIP